MFSEITFILYIRNYSLVAYLFFLPKFNANISLEYILL
jgi:hypothetical protein